jgi:hypothetical protein
MGMVYKNYKIGEIAARMLETSLHLYFDGGDGFAIIHLAANAEEVLAGFIQKNKTKENISETICTARDKAIAALKEIHAIHGQERSKDEIGIYLNFVRNKTKHRGAKSDSDEIAVCLELEVEFAISSAIENYVLYFKDPTEKMLRYINRVSLHRDDS